MIERAKTQITNAMINCGDGSLNIFVYLSCCDIRVDYFTVPGTGFYSL